MVRRRACLLAVLSCLAVGAVAAPSVGDPTLESRLVEAVWRLDRDFSEWAGDSEVAHRKGVPFAGAFRSSEDFLAALEDLTGHLPASVEARARVERKLSIVRDHIQSWRPPALTAGGVGTPAPAFEPGERPRAVSPGSRCGESSPVGYGTFGWAVADLDSDGSSAWLRFRAPRTGWHRLHTAGSGADTAVSVLERCAGSPLVEDDDGLGLQSMLSFFARAGEELWVRVDSLAADGGSSVLVTVESTGAGVLSGTVVEEQSGGPVTNVRVELYYGTGSYYGSSSTNGAGSYAFTGLSPDSYYVLTDDTDEHLDELWDDHPCEPNCSVFEGDLVTVSEAEPGTADFVLQRGASISGQVLETGAGPVSSAQVRLADSSGGFVASTNADASGLYDFVGLSAGIYFAYTNVNALRNEVWDDIPCDPSCDPENGNPIILGDGEARLGVNFTLDREGSISGSIVDAETGLPVSFGRVEFFRADGGYAGSVSSSSDGSWQSFGLAAGIYYVASDLSSNYLNEVYDDIPCLPFCEPLTGKPVPVALNANTPGVDFALERLGSITGMISDSKFGVPLSSIRVETWNESGALVRSTNSTPAGHYEAGSLQPGSYFVATDEDGVYVDELYDDIPCPLGPPTGCDPSDGTPLLIELRTILSDVDLALDRGGSVSGVLTDLTTGDPIVGQNVGLTALVSAPLVIDVTDVEGKFLFGGLSSGTYFVHTITTSHDDEIWDDVPCSGSCNPTTGTPILVLVGEESPGIDFGLLLLGGAAGSIQDEAGEPLAGAVVHAWDNSGTIVGTAVSNAAGVYQVDLNSGLFRFSTANQHGLPDELWNDIPCRGGAASDGGCDPLEGDPVILVGADPVVTGIDFELGPTIFADGFESGDLSAWSNAVP